jgi:hypothetical protein
VEGLDNSWVASTPALPNAGAMELAHTGLDPLARAGVGGGDWTALATSGAPSDTGLNWTATGDPVPAGWAGGGDTRAMLDDWRNLFNPHSPSFWALGALLVVVGLLHVRVNTRFGPAGAHLHVG